MDLKLMKPRIAAKFSPQWQDPLQLRQWGTLALPAKVSAGYSLEQGDILTQVELGGVFFQAPTVSVVPNR